MGNKQKKVSNVVYLLFSIEAEISDRLDEKNMQVAQRQDLNKRIMLNDCTKEELVEIIQSLTNSLYDAAYCAKMEIELKDEESEELTAEEIAAFEALKEAELQRRLADIIPTASK